MAAARFSASSMKRLTPMPALPETITVVAAPRGCRRERVRDSRELRFASDEAPADAPFPASMHCRRTPGSASRPLPCRSAAASPAPPLERPQRAVGRGVALLHEVGVDHGLPLGAGAPAAQGPRRQQAAAAHGPAHRVLHEERRARARPLRGRRRDAPGRGHRPGSAAGDRLRARPALGRRSTARPSRRCSPSATAPGRCWRTWDRRTRAASAASTRPGWSMRLGDARTLLPAMRVGVDRLRRHRPAVQRPAAR